MPDYLELLLYTASMSWDRLRICLFSWDFCLAKGYYLPNSSIWLTSWTSVRIVC